MEDTNILEALAYELPKNTESLAKIDKLLGHLPKARGTELPELSGSFPVVFSDTLSQTHFIEHDRYDHYCLDIRHLKGKDNVVARALSRAPV